VSLLVEVVFKLFKCLIVQCLELRAKLKNLQMGKKKFNMDPKKGVEFLVEHGLIRKTPEEVAAFLYKGEGLNKTAIGDYLGEKNDFNEAVLKAFVDLHDFSDLILVQALRQFLWSFRYIILSFLLNS
jgi:cytohesin